MQQVLSQSWLIPALILSVVVVAIVLAIRERLGKKDGETKKDEKKEVKKSWSWPKVPWGKLTAAALISFLLFGTPTGQWLTGSLWGALMSPPDFNRTKVLRPYDGAPYWEEASGLNRYADSWQHLPQSWMEEASPTASGEPPLLFGGTMPPQVKTRLTFAPTVSTQSSGTDRWYWAMFKRDARLATEEELTTLLASGAGLGSFPQVGYDGEHKNSFEEVYLVALRGFPADGPQQVHVTHSSIPGVGEYVLRVTEPDQFRLTMPEGVRYMWIVAPPSASWETKYAGEEVPPEGLANPEDVADRAYVYASLNGKSHEEAENFAHRQIVERVTPALETRPELNFLATYYQVAGEERAPIMYSRTFTSLDAGRTVTIGLNAPGGVKEKDAAKVIVGFQR